MSLLMDALKKAEEAKRLSAATAEIEPKKPDLSAEAADAVPVETPPVPPGLPELPASLELLDHEFHTEPQMLPPAPPTPAADSPPPLQPQKKVPDELGQERAAAKNVFQAKLSQPRRNFLVIAGMAGLLAAAGIGGWFWWQLQPGGNVGVAPMASRTAQPSPPVSSPASTAPLPPPLPSAPEPEEVEAGTVPSTPIIAGRSAPPRQAEPATAPAKIAATDTDSPIRISRGHLQVNQQVAGAYQAFQSGDLAAAERDYHQALKKEPNNTDALHGLAAIGLRQGKVEQAENYYLRILDADPKDAAAQAAIISLRGQGDPLQAESRLKNLLAGQPDSPALLFALGNLYGRQGRWNEAQQAYFRAYASDGENPDYQFNLAVSLEQLRQPKLALQYYQGALAAAAQRPAAFDRNQVAGRIRELQQ